MKNKIISYLNKTHGLKTARRGIVLALTLALLSYNFGSGVLQSLGATETDAPTCGLEDHVHTHDCYASVLACDHTEGPDGSAPIHDGTCYISQTICGMQEHVHTDECYAEAVENTVSDSDAQKVLSNGLVGKNLTTLSASSEIEMYADQQNLLNVITSYGPVDPKTATNMYNGKWEEDNSENNRYVLFVGETLELAALGNILNPSWTIINPNGSGDDPNFKTEGSQASYFATTPGNYKITLEYSSGEDSSGNRSSTFYFEVKYPIFVKTAVGEVHKDKVHEYLDAAPGHTYNENPQAFITTPDGKEKNNALYVKNLKDDPGKYIMYPNNTVTLSAYYLASGNSSPVFETSSTNLEKGNTDIDNISINNINFTKVTTTFKATGAGDAYVTFGDEKFFIYVRNANHVGDANHFDIEIADGSTYTDTITTINADGSSKIVTTNYAAVVTQVNLCTVNDSTGKAIGYLYPQDYFNHGTQGGVQFELTSAYETDGKIQTGGLKIRDEFDGPKVAEVVFDVNISLIPQSQTITERDANGSEHTSVTDSESLKGLDTTIRKEYRLGSLYILDALNKCPAHNGLDFTILSGNERINLEPAVHKTLESPDGTKLNLKQGQFTFGLWTDSDLSQEPFMTAVNDPNGNVYFDDIEDLNSNDETQLVYYIKEINTQQEDIVYDTTIYKMTVSFNKNADTGEIVPTVTYECSLDGGNEYNSYTSTPEFTNIDTTPPTLKSAVVEPNIQKTLVNASGSKLDLSQWRFTFGLWDSSNFSQDPVKTFYNDKNGNVSFDNFFTYTSEDFDKSDHYVYYIKEITGDVKDIKFDTTIYRMTVDLEENLAEGKIVANVTYAYSQDGSNRYLPYHGGDTLQFVNTNTTPESTLTPAEVTPTVHKTLENANGYKLNLKQGQFGFGLYTDLSRNPVDKAWNDQNGYVSFDKLTFTSKELDQSTKWVYYIKELEPSDQKTGIKYDTTIYKMTVTLSKNTSAGRIDQSVRYEYSTNGGKNFYPYTGITPEFVNIDTTAPVDVTVEKVWDDNNSKDRPESVVIQLLKDDKTVYGEVTLSNSNKWQYTWESLDGNVEWSVQEANIPDGYSAIYQKNGLHFTVTNTAALPQTGQLNWPIPVLFGCGLILITLGSIWERSGRKKKPDEN